jgi:hypothetical protein
MGVKGLMKYRRERGRQEGAKARRKERRKGRA